MSSFVSSYSSFPSSVVASSMGTTVMPASVMGVPLQQQSQSFAYSSIFPPTQVAGAGKVGMALGSPTTPNIGNACTTQQQCFGFDSIYKPSSQPMNYAMPANAVMGTPLMGSPVVGGTPVSYFGNGVGVPAQGLNVNYFPSSVPVMGQQMPGTPIKGPVYTPQFAGKQFSHGYPSQAVPPQYQSPVEGVPVVGHQNQFSQHPHYTHQQHQYPHQYQHGTPQSPLDINAPRRVYRGGEIDDGKKKRRKGPGAGDAALVGGAALIGAAAVAAAVLCPLSLLALPIAAGVAAAAC